MSLGQSFKDALNTIAEAEDASIEIYDYCDECDLQNLWALSEPQHIIIVWDGRKNEIKQTPMRWALDFSIKMLDSNPKADISISIVDLTGEKHDQECGMRMRQELLAEMPWVKLYVPLVPENSGEKVWFREGYIRLLGDPCSLLRGEGNNFRLNSCGRIPGIIDPLRRCCMKVWLGS